MRAAGWGGQERQRGIGSCRRGGRQADHPCREGARGQAQSVLHRKRRAALLDTDDKKLVGRHLPLFVLQLETGKDKPSGVTKEELDKEVQAKKDELQKEARTGEMCKGSTPDAGLRKRDIPVWLP